MISWWEGLTALGRALFGGAVFFSTVFLWQFAASLSGLGGDQGDLDADADASLDVDAADGADTGDAELLEDAAGLATLRLLSFRSALAFGMLFCWAGTLYLSQGRTPAGALIRALLWGVAGMLCVALFFWLLPRLAEEGTANLDTAVGRAALVYLDIPEDGLGQVRVIVSGTLSFVRARSAAGQPIKAGTDVRVLRRLDARTLEVEPIER
jgi:hypothetical protein